MQVKKLDVGLAESASARSESLNALADVSTNTQQGGFRYGLAQLEITS